MNIAALEDEKENNDKANKKNDYSSNSSSDSESESDQDVSDTEGLSKVINSILQNSQ